MKVGKITSTDVTGNLITGGSAIGGMLLSNGAAQAIPVENKTVVRGVLAALGLFGCLAIKGKDGLTSTVKGISGGVALQQTKELIKGFVVDHLPANDGSAFNDFINAAFENQTPALAMPGMGNPEAIKWRLANPMPARQEADNEGWALV